MEKRKERTCLECDVWVERTPEEPLCRQPCEPDASARALDQRHLYVRVQQAWFSAALVGPNPGDSGPILSFRRSGEKSVRRPVGSGNIRHRSEASLEKEV